MKSLKYIVLSSFLLATPSHSGSLEDGIGKLSKTISSKLSGVASTSKARDVLCKKANLFGGKISLRSLKGILGNAPVIGPWGLEVCKGYSGFESSQFYKNAKGKLGGKQPKEALESQLSSASSGVAGKAKGLVCSAKAFAPDQVKPILDKACGA